MADAVVIGTPTPGAINPLVAWEAGMSYPPRTVLTHGNAAWISVVLTTQEPAPGCSDWNVWIDGRGGELASAAMAEAVAAKEDAQAAQEAAQASAEQASDAADLATAKAAAALTSAQQASDARDGAAASLQAATAKALDATTAASQSQQIAANMSSQLYACDGVDLQRSGALVSVARGLYMLGGSQVSLSAILAASTPAKWVMGPTGIYQQSAINTVAIDYSSGRGRAVISAGATNSWLNSEDATKWTAQPWCLATVQAGALFGALARVTLTAQTTDPNAAQWSPAIAVSPGEVVTFTIAVKQGTWTGTSRLALYHSVDGFAPTSFSAQVVYGPGAINTPSTALWTITPSASGDTIYRVSCVVKSAGTLNAVFYFTAGAAPTVGATVQVGMPQLERGWGSAYIISGATASTRAADVVTLTPAALALLQGGAKTIALRGDLGRAPSAPVALIGSTSAGRYGAITRDASGVNRVVLADNSASIAAAADAPGARVALCASLYQGVKGKLASSGGAVTALAGATVWSASDAAIQIGAANGVASPSELYVDELCIWPLAASDAATIAQARVYQ